MSILKFSSNVKEFVIQNILLKKKPKPNTIPKIKKFFSKGFFSEFIF